MKAKDIIITIVLLVLVFTLASVCYSLGYRNGALRDFEMHRARGRLAADLLIYEEAQRGDLQAVRDHLGIVILGQTRTYEQAYGVPKGTDSFAQKFLAAQAIASRTESNLVPITAILTNFPHTPDAKVTVNGR